MTSPRPDGAVTRAAARRAADTLAILPEAMKYARAERGLSLREAARQVGIGHGTWWQLERRRRDVTREKAIRILRWLSGDVK